MKRVLSALLVICFVFAAFSTVTITANASLDTPDHTFFVKYVGAIDGEDYEGTKPVIDGIVADEKEWNPKDFKAWPKYEGGQVAMYYDEDNLYVAIKIANEEINTPFYPSYDWGGQDRFSFWIDPTDQGDAVGPVGEQYQGYFMEFYSQFAGANGVNGSALLDRNLGVDAQPLLVYHEYTCATNMDKPFADWVQSITPEKPEKVITFENDKPWGMKTPDGEWTLEYQIPLPLMGIMEDITVTDSDDFGDYITFSGWYQESKDSTKDNVVKDIYHIDNANLKHYYMAGNFRNSWNYARGYFSDARPGEKANNPNEKSTGSINPSGEAERTAEEADGAAKTSVKKAPLINGKLDDEAWDLSRMPMRSPSNEFDSYYDIQWDKDYLYIAVDTGDKTVTAPKAIDFDSLNSVTEPINPASYDFIRIDLDPTASRKSIDVADRAFSIYLPRAESGSEEYFIAMSGVNWGKAEFKKGLQNGDSGMKIKYSNAMDNKDSWKAEVAIPWSMFQREGYDELFPSTGKVEDFYGKDVAVSVGYSNSMSKKQIVEKEESTGENVTVTTSEEIVYIPVYNNQTNDIGVAYRYPFLRMVKDAGLYNKEIKDNAISFKVDKKFLEQNTHALVYNFDAVGYDKAEVEIPVESLNRQNYTSYYINMDNGIRVEIPSGLFTNNLLKGDKTVAKSDKVVFSIEKEKLAKEKDEFFYPEVSFKMTINGKTVVPQTPVKLTYPLDTTVATTEYDAFKLQVEDEAKQVYPLTNTKFVDRYAPVVDPETNTEVQQCIARSYVVKTVLSGNYKMAKNMTTAGDIEGWYKPFIEKVMKSGLLKGYDEGGIIFKPKQNISRAEVATLVMRLAQKSINVDAAGVEKFKDVQEDDWFNTMVYRAKALGYINGVGDGKFEPKNPITRGDFFTLLHRALVTMDLKFKDLNHLGFANEFDNTDFHLFKEGQRYSYAYSGAVFCYSNGIVGGSEEDDGQKWMRPERPITRGEIAKMVAVLLDDFIVPQANK